MTQSRVHLQVSRFLAAVLVLTATAAVSHAQSRGDCSAPAPPGVGLSVGRSSPYFEVNRGVVPGDERGSLLLRGGRYLAGRVDVPVAGAWRTRVEGSVANWRVERQTYDEGFALIAQDTVGQVDARQIFAMVGRQGGRRPACGYVLAGGGIYWLDYEGARLRSPGVALTAGLEVPTGDHGAVQVDVQLHLIDTRTRHPISSSTVLAASLSVGWSYRF